MTGCTTGFIVLSSSYIMHVHTYSYRKKGDSTRIGGDNGRARPCAGASSRPDPRRDIDAGSLARVLEEQQRREQHCRTRMAIHAKHLRIERWLALAVVVFLVSALDFALGHRVAPISWGLWGKYNATSGLALKGYDPVAYFVSGKPVEGTRQFSVDWDGVRWRFADAGDRDLFLTDPQSFVPQFGGYCALAVSKGFTADIAPQAWVIYEQKLYLFGDANARAEWVATLARGSLKSAEANWRNRARSSPLWWRLL
jgi:hypothetical protein